MKKFLRKQLAAGALAILVGVPLCSTDAGAQILMSAGNYAQHFDALADSGGNHPWTDNVTLPGWYAAKEGAPATTYAAGTGSGNAGGLYSFGVSGVNDFTDRALGSLASGSAGALAFGVRFLNDTGATVSNLVVSFTGEQWRNANGTGAVTNTLSFSYRVAAGPLAGADALNTQSWTAESALDFPSPVVDGGGNGTALDGNAAANRRVFANVPLAGVAVPNGQEIFLRWRDVDDSGSDAGLAVDDVTVNFETAGSSSNPPAILVQPVSAVATAGDTVSFSVLASGAAPLHYQWQSNNIPITGATSNRLTLADVTTNWSGSLYFVTITNAFGFTNSAGARLTVQPPPPRPANTNGGITLMTYNVKGNGVADWSTNSAQVQAIGREIEYLHPDLITFNEIPHTNVWQMANWVAAFMPGFHLATNSGTDGFINSVIASRFPIIRSQRWLTHADLNPFGYTNANFTRDLFEAEVAIPDWSQPLHVFTTHLKSSSGGYPEAAAKRAAEAAAITNFFATNILAEFPPQPFTLSGDMNESDTNTAAIQELLSAPGTLRLTNPKNPYSGATATYSIQGSLTERIDYIFPCTLLFSNILDSQVFRTDLLTNSPSNLHRNDDATASDHLPVLMTFANPFVQPYAITRLGSTNGGVTLQWQSVPGQNYQVETSSNLISWTALAASLTATNYSFTVTTNLAGTRHFFRVKRVN
jgi:endonuclease/exonuclease/phosphatase family metal-dependent hydrolase